MLKPKPHLFYWIYHLQNSKGNLFSFITNTDVITSSPNTTPTHILRVHFQEWLRFCACMETLSRGRSGVSRASAHRSLGVKTRCTVKSDCRPDANGLAGWCLKVRFAQVSVLWLWCSRNAAQDHTNVFPSQIILWIWRPGCVYVLEALGD